MPKRTMGLYSQSERTTASKHAPRRATPTVIVEPQRSAWVYDLQPPTGPLVYVPRLSPASPCVACPTNNRPSDSDGENTRHGNNTAYATPRQHSNETHAEKSAACDGRSLRRIDEPSSTHNVNIGGQASESGGGGDTRSGDGRRSCYGYQGWGRGRALDAPRWELRERCGSCCVAFTLFNPRHHCRNCGRSVCGKHSSHRFPLPHYGMADFMRVCDDCHASLVTHFRGLAHNVFRANSAEGAAANGARANHHHHHHHRQQAHAEHTANVGV